jgi:hypothetical protein
MNHYPIVRPSLLSQALAGDWPGTDSMLRPESASTVVYAAASKQTVQLEQQLRELQLPPSPRMAEPARKRSLEENLFDATAAVKTLTSQVAMHLDREWRAKLFRQLDSLHDPAEWEAGDIPVQKASFATFLKAICDIRPARRPGPGSHKLWMPDCSLDDRQERQIDDRIPAKRPGALRVVACACGRH